MIAREVTKLHEEFLRGGAREVLETLKARDGVKGEITLLIGKADEAIHGVADASSARFIHPAKSGADHGRGESGRESRAEESGERTWDFEERSIPGAAKE